MRKLPLIIKGDGMKPGEIIDCPPGSVVMFDPRPAYMPRLKHTTCQGCGAPLRVAQDECEYCGRGVELIYEEVRL